MKLGLLGGAFDPIHWGHLGAALECAYQLNLDEVWLTPGADPPFKSPAAPAEQRFAMTELAAQEGPRLHASRLELDLPTPSFSVNTLRELRRQLPHADLYFIVGTDAAAGLNAWREPLEIRALAKLVVVQRAGWVQTVRSGQPAPGGAGYNANAANGRLGLPAFPLPGGPPSAVIEWPGVAVTSSEVRRRLKAGAPVEYLLPRSVADYIREHQLYR